MWAPFEGRRLRLLDGGQRELLSVIPTIYDRGSRSFLFPRVGKFWDVVQKAHAAGFRGQGQIIGIFDSGIDLTDRFLTDALIDSIDFTQSRHPVAGQGQDGHGHGTVVALLMRAIAPEAKLLNLKVMDDDGFGGEARLRRAMRWISERKITVANLSIGRPSMSRLSFALSSDSWLVGIWLRAILNRAVQAPDDAATYLKQMNGHWLRRCSLCREVDDLAERGVPVCVSIGNFRHYASCPARAESALSVGGASIIEGVPNEVAAWQQKLADLPSFHQSIGADLVVVAGFDVVPGSSMLAPMGTGLCALGMTLDEWRGGEQSFDRVINAVVRANQLMAAGQYKAAGALYLHALSLSPHQTEHKGTRVRHECWLCALFLGECLTNLGLAHLAIGQMEHAETTLEEAVKLTPFEAPAHLNRGAVLRTLKRYDEAIASYKTAIQLEPANPRAYEGLGTTYELSGNRAEAEASYKRAIALDPSSRFARGFLERPI